MTSTQPRVTRHCRELNFWAPREPRHSHQAGTASSSHARLSRSSITTKGRLEETNPRTTVFQKPRFEVNVTSVTWKLAAQETAVRTFFYGDGAGIVGE